MGALSELLYNGHEASLDQDLVFFSNYKTYLFYTPSKY